MHYCSYAFIMNVDAGYVTVDVYVIYVVYQINCKYHNLNARDFMKFYMMYDFAHTNYGVSFL